MARRSGQLAQAEPDTALGESAVVRKTVSFADRVAASRDTTALAKKLEAADVSLRPGEWAVVHGLIAVLAALLATLLSGLQSCLALIAFALAWCFPGCIWDDRASKRARQFYEPCPTPCR